MSLDVSGSPYDIFADWFQKAQQSEPTDPNAMALATASKAGLPSVRMVLLKEWDESGFVFYTNLESRKGQELAENPNAALCFYWKSLQKQVRIEGEVEPVPNAQADAYYNSRARGSRIGAWASKQSAVMEDRTALERRYKKFEAEFDGLEDIPRPEFWSGFRLKPVRFEFWENRESRLHDRVRFVKKDDAWEGALLYP